MMTARSKVFYREEMVAVFKTDSPSPRKPTLVVQDWQAAGLPFESVSFAPVSQEYYLLAHDSVFVEGIFSRKLQNGFFNREEQVIKSLSYTTGAMLASATDAIENQSFTCASVFGFHHAMYAGIGVYCTFNGLIVTAQLLKKAGLASQVGILDYDMHYGDGTDDIIQRLGLGFISHYTSGK